MKIQDARYGMQDTASPSGSSAFRRTCRGEAGRGCNILLLLSFLCCLLFTICSLSHAENLSDIKFDALNEPIKEKWGRDPFIRYGEKMSKLKGMTFREDVLVDLKITGIISDGKKAVAIINGGFYRKNEKVNDFLIVEIAKDKVTLEKNGKRFYLGVEKFTMGVYKEKEKDEGKDKDKKEDKEGKK